MAIIIIYQILKFISKLKPVFSDCLYFTFFWRSIHTIGKGLQIEAADVNWHLARRRGLVERREGCNLLGRELTGNCYYKYLDTLEGNSHVINQYSSTVNIQLCPAIGFLLTVEYIVSKVESYSVYSDIFFLLCRFNLHSEVNGKRNVTLNNAE